MNMIEALRIARSDTKVWARPISWRGLRDAIAWNPDDYWEVVPNDGGVHHAKIPDQEAFEDWKVVEPDKVNNGD